MHAEHEEKIFLCDLVKSESPAGEFLFQPLQHGTEHLNVFRDHSSGFRSHA
jgi:hypothetical protein